MNVSHAFIVFASVWLVITTAIGVLLATNLYWPFMPVDHLEVLKLHAHAGFAGWFLQLIMGVSVKLLPMFLLSRSKKTSLLRYALILPNCGLMLFLADGFINGVSDRSLVWAGLVSAGILCWLAFIVDVFRNRVKKKIDIYMKHSIASFVCLILSLIVIPLVLSNKGGPWPVLYGTLIFMGWITLIILGKTFKTLPFIVWNQQYQHLHGQSHVPMPRDLYAEKLVRYQFFIYVPALPVLLAGIYLNEPLMIRFALCCWIVVALLYLKNVLTLIFHKKAFADDH